MFDVLLMTCYGCSKSGSDWNSVRMSEVKSGQLLKVHLIIIKTHLILVIFMFFGFSMKKKSKTYKYPYREIPICKISIKKPLKLNRNSRFWMVWILTNQNQAQTSKFRKIRKTFEVLFKFHVFQDFFLTPDTLGKDLIRNLIPIWNTACYNYNNR